VLRAARAEVARYPDEGQHEHGDERDPLHGRKVVVAPGFSSGGGFFIVENAQTTTTPIQNTGSATAPNKNGTM
jgi:hypothetical protein